MNRITKTLTVKGSVFDEILTLTGRLEADPDSGRDEVIWKDTVVFDDGMQMDIKVVNSESGIWTEGVLFDHGSEIGCTEVDEELGGEYIVKDGETEYCVIVERDTAGYNDKLDPDTQISAEEMIGAHLFDHYGVNENRAQEASQEILLMVLKQFRPDLLEQ